MDNVEDVKFEFVEDPIDGNSAVYNEHVEESFGEVLELTEYSGNNLETQYNTSLSNYSDSEYEDINLFEVSSKQQNLAKNFVMKVEKFLLRLDTDSPTKEQKAYMDVVAKLELHKLQDLLILTEVNMQLLNNLTKRINSVQAEDYAMIQTYNTLVNQHIKLHREVGNTYRNIPVNMRKLKADVIGSDITNNKPTDDGLLTQDFGTSQFNNSKQLLKNLETQKKERDNK